ncbi:MAG: hypothetical protein QOJ96_437 [Alphaproteobacteria bacterium]|jgi:hypothetical protein|nr:hypothetical protein [Alphaproteobacteria bacterium]
MQRASCVVLGVVVALSTTQARTETMQWKQTLNLPKGMNLPKDVKADILGIEPGDTYAELKPKLEALLKESVRQLPPQRTRAQKRASEGMGNDDSPPMTEESTTLRFPTPGGVVELEPYAAVINLKRELPGTGKPTITDLLTIYLSGPASGHQVLGVVRVLSYNANEDQPRISEIIPRLAEKYKSSPQTFTAGPGAIYRFQFDNGRAIAPSGASATTCQPVYNIDKADYVPQINRDGTCDVVLSVSVYPGLTADHAKRIEFALGDNERAKANLTADFGFLDAYVRDMQGKAKGVAPKL